MRCLPASDRALLLELQDLAQVMVVYRHMAAHPVMGVHELVPAARTLLVHFDPLVTTAPSLAAVLGTLAQQALVMEQQTASTPGQLVQVPVRYGGGDIAQVAEMLGLSVAQLIAQHTAQPYDAAFAGFAPGFVYLSGGAGWQVPRRATPRTKVPAGSVALGGEFSAVYPIASPGGWQLIGTTDVAMWDLQRQEPAYIQPGFRVQFVDAARTSVAVPLSLHSDAHPSLESKTPFSEVSLGHVAIEIVNSGWQTLVQDAGRHGMSARGISASGALDVCAMQAANRVVGNPQDAAVLEHLGGQLCLRSQGAVTLSVTGADTALMVASAAGHGWQASTYQALALNAGDTLQLHAPTAGLRSYVAVRGGWHVAPVLGSCATDTLAGIGPAALQNGQCVGVGQVVPAKALRPVALWESAPVPLPRAGDVVLLDITLGPRADWFTDAAVRTLLEQAWQVTPQSNRVGMRLQGEQALQRQCHQELPSEGTVAGAIQVPASGQPVLFLADHPLTGGYPVVGALASHHLSLAAQIPVGCWIRFRCVAPLQAYSESPTTATEAGKSTT